MTSAHGDDGSSDGRNRRAFLFCPFLGQVYLAEEVARRERTGPCEPGGRPRRRVRALGRPHLAKSPICAGEVRVLHTCAGAGRHPHAAGWHLGMCHLRSGNQMWLLYQRTVAQPAWIG